MKIKLILIVLLAAFLRIWQLNVVPPHLTPDEAALGYNAYSILKTGRDEYGSFFPIIFKSFGDYKPGFYVYTTVPFIYILGLNEYSVRLPSAIAGIIAVWLIYLIVLNLTKSKSVALYSSFFLTVLPWHIHFSRGAWEINLSLTLTLGGIYLFLIGLKKGKYLILSALLFGLTFITYQGAKLSTGIVLLLLGVMYFKELRKINYLIVGCATLLGILITSPILLSFTQGQTGRLTVFSVFSYPRPEKYLQDFLDQGNENVGGINYYLFHPEWFNFTRGVMGRYFNHFSGRFLFFEGDWQNPRHNAPYVGGLLLSDLILLMFGVLFVVKSKISKEYLFVIIWLLLAPLPSVLSRDQVHAVRSYNMLIPLVILLATGLHYIVVDKRIIRRLFLLLFIPIYLFNFIYYLDSYFVHIPKHNSKYWEYGYKQIVESVLPIKNNYSQITIQQSYSQPYIYFLFYGAALGLEEFQPYQYQKEARLKESEFGDVGQVERIGNICFCAIDWSRNRGDKGTIIVADTLRIPPGDSRDEKHFRLIKEIMYLNNVDTAFRIIEIKQ